MPARDEGRRKGDQEPPEDWREELSEAIEELDRACARARQLIYQLRPLLRSGGTDEGQPRERREPSRFSGQREGRDRGRSGR